jgi:GGDEF domain-containing protein
MGGDEFAILVADAPNGSADAVAARLLAERGSATCSFSIGVAHRERGERLAQTLERADQDLYARRRAARARPQAPA